MSVVRIRQELYEQVTKLAVKATIETQQPVRQGELINLLLDKVLDDYTARDLISEYHEMKKKQEKEKEENS